MNNIGTEYGSALWPRLNANRLIVVCSYLVITTFVCHVLVNAASGKLLHKNFPAWNKLASLTPSIYLLTYLIQLTLILLLLKRQRRHSDAKPVKAPAIIDSFYGFVVGLAAFAVSLPILFWGDPYAVFWWRVIDAPFAASSVLTGIALVIVVPIITEVVFRGILLESFLSYSNVAMALLASSLLFAFVWPFTNPIVSTLLGLSMGLLYRRSRSRIPSTIAMLAFMASFLLYVAHKMLSTGG